MDHQWRSSPIPRPIHGNLCPTCSISHSPFCPPPPSYHQPPRFPFQPDPSFQLPSFSSYSRPCGPNPNDVFANPWNPNWAGHCFSFRSPYEHGNPLAEADRNFKRPRIDNPGTYANDYDQNQAGNFSEDQRRLKLIRDHGVAQSNPPQLDRNFVSGQYKQHNRNGFHSDSNHGIQKGEFPPLQHHQLETSLYLFQNGRTTNLDQQQHMDDNHMRHDFHPSAQLSDVTLPPHEVSSNFSENIGQMEASRLFRGQPPLPSSPPPPLPLDPPSLFPVHVSSSSMAPSSYAKMSEAHSLAQPYFHSKPFRPFSAGFPLEEQSELYMGDAKPFSLKQSRDETKFIDASNLFKHPHRTSRPDHFVIILRGLPGSGKSYLAKMLRDIEVENGCDAPRIHSMDDYFITEVEKVEDIDASKSLGSGRNKKPVMKKVMEYCYEPEMEQAYRLSMLKAFKKTVEEGIFTFIIVDDRNLRVADFDQFWATAKRSGYEVYILEATYKDPAGCAARNVHGFTQEDIEKMAGQWEEAPSLYLQLDLKSLLHGDDLKDGKILEVDMDMEDDLDDAFPSVQGREAEKVVDPFVKDDTSGSSKYGKRWDAEVKHSTEVRELGKSKWSEDLGEDDIDKTEGLRGNINALSGLICSYSKERKSVHWGDQVGNTGFSIGTARKINALSLVIGPGAGFNLKSNPLPEEGGPTQYRAVPKKNSIFQKRIQAEHESFKAVFDRRRQLIGGLDVEEG